MKFVQASILLAALLLAAPRSWAEQTTVFLGFVSQYEQGSKDEGHILVGSIVERSPAQRAGLKIGDVIVTIDGESFRFDNQLQWIQSTAQFRPEVPVVFGITRGPKRIDIRIVPVAADHNQKRLVGQYIEQLEKCYTLGDCSACSTPKSDSESAVKVVGRYDLDKKILDSGGTAILTVEKTQKGLVFSSDEVAVPAGFSLADDRYLTTHAERLKPGQSFRVKIEVEDKGRLTSSTELLDPAGH